MKVMQKFQCEICRTEYATKKDAMACEKNHKLVKAVEELRYLPKSQDGKGYPVSITVRMSDGEKLIYKR